MKYLDEVKVTVSKKEYEDAGVFKGAIGTIILSELRSNTFDVVFFDKKGYDYAYVSIHVADMELYQDRHMSDEAILEDLPLHDPHWWCKVENGFIYNLLGEKKNKIAYDYES